MRKKNPDEKLPSRKKEPREKLPAQLLKRCWAQKMIKIDCMFFSKYYAVHGSYEVPNYNASHGCIRVTPADAKWLYYNFIEIGTPVVVKPY